MERANGTCNAERLPPPPLQAAPQQAAGTPPARHASTSASWATSRLVASRRRRLARLQAAAAAAAMLPGGGQKAGGCMGRAGGRGARCAGSPLSPAGVVAAAVARHTAGENAKGRRAFARARRHSIGLRRASAGRRALRPHTAGRRCVTRMLRRRCLLPPLPRVLRCPAGLLHRQRGLQIHKLKGVSSVQQFTSCLAASGRRYCCRRSPSTPS